MDATAQSSNPWVPRSLVVPSHGALDLDSAEHRRRERRYLVNQPAQLVATGLGGGMWTVQIRDISPKGMQLVVEEAVQVSPEVKVRWNGRQVNGTVRYNHKYDAALYRIGVELDARADEFMRELLARQSEELRDANITLEHQAALAQQYGDLLNLTLEAVTVFSPEGIVFFWNAAAERLYGWERGEVIGRNLRQLLRPDAADEIQERRLQQFRKDGTLVSVAARWVVERTPDGNPLAIICLSRNATEG